MAGRIPQTFIDDLLNRVDIVEIIDSRVPLKKAGREYGACCPFHNEKTPSFTVSPVKQFYHCFGCGAHGSAVSFLMEYERLEFPEAIEELARSVGMEIAHETAANPAVHDHRTHLYTVLDKVDQFFRHQLREHPQASGAVDYLKERGLSGEIAVRFGLGYAPPGWDSLLSHLGSDPASIQAAAELGLLVERDGGGQYDRFRDRVMFPIRDRRGRTIGFGGRVLGDEKPKYMNSPENTLFHKGQELYGLFEARKSGAKLERLLVVEGYMDVVALSQFGLTNAVATLGTATTPEHLERLFRTVPEVVFCFDGDKAGRRAAWRAMENSFPVIREGREARFLFLPDGEDPDSLVRKEGTDAFQQRTVDSVPFSTFFYESLCQQVDIQSVNGRANLVEKARPFLQQLTDGVFRDLMLDRLAELSGMDSRRLQQRWYGEAAKVEVQRPRNTASDHSRGPVRTAIHLLLEKPVLASIENRPNGFNDLRIPGIELLIKILDILDANPHLNTAAIVEHWRGQPEQKHLAKLLSMDSEIPEDGYEKELFGALQRLVEQRNEQRFADLLLKEQQSGLNGAEKDELKQVIIESQTQRE